MTLTLLHHRSTGDKRCKGHAPRCKLCLLCWKDPQELILLFTCAAPLLAHGEATGTPCWAATAGILTVTEKPSLTPNSGYY